MPSKTEKQHRAMEAAAHGNSTLGIPQKVGKEFVKADARKPAALAKGGKLVDHGDHFKVHAVTGQVHTIAKKGLHPSTVKHLQQFCEGGPVKMAEGGKASGYDDPSEGVYRGGGGPGIEEVTPETRTPEQGAAADEEAARGEGAPGTGETALNSEEEQRGEDTARAWGWELPPQDTGGQFEGIKGSPIAKEAPSGGDMPPGAQPAQPSLTSENVGEQLGKFGSAKVHGITAEEKAAVGDAASARTANAEAQEKLAGETERVNNEKVAKMQQLEKDSDAKMDAINKRADQLRADIENGKIDPNHYWHEKGTGGRIMASIGLLLSGIGSGLNGGPNMAMQVIQANIKRDIEAQERNLHTKQSLLADTYRQTGDLRLARQMAEHTATNVALAQLNTIAAKSSSAQAKAIAQVANAQGQLLLAQQARGIADRQSANDMAAHNANVAAQNAALLQKAKAGDGLKTPREMQGAKIANYDAVIKDVKQHLLNLGEGTQGPVAGRIAEHFPWGGANTKANAAAADALREKLASALGGGVASDARIKAAAASVPDPTDTPEQAKVKIARIVSLLETNRDEYINQQAGVGYKVAPGLPEKPAAPSLKR